MTLSFKRLHKEKPENLVTFVGKSPNANFFINLSKLPQPHYKAAVLSNCSESHKRVISTPVQFSLKRSCLSRGLPSDERKFFRIQERLRNEDLNNLQKRFQRSASLISYNNSSVLNNKNFLKNNKLPKKFCTKVSAFNEGLMNTSFTAGTNNSLSLKDDFTKTYKEKIESLKIESEQLELELLKKFRDVEISERETLKSLGEYKVVSPVQTFTAEEQKQLKKAFLAVPGTLLVEGFNQELYAEDIIKLKGTNWLNDEIINFYAALIVKRSEEFPFLPKVHMFNTFFYPLLVKGYHKVRRWTRKLKIFELDILLAPIHLVNHWCLVSVDFKRKIIAYHDSLGGSNRRILHLFKQYLQEEHMDKLNSPFDTSNWKLHSLKNTIPLQTNGADCGVFTCVYAECISRSAFFDFSQDDMPYFRKRLAIEILNKRLCMPQTP